MPDDDGLLKALAALDLEDDSLEHNSISQAYSVVKRNDAAYCFAVSCPLVPAPGDEAATVTTTTTTTTTTSREWRTYVLDRATRRVMATGTLPAAAITADDLAAVLVSCAPQRLTVLGSFDAPTLAARYGSNVYDDDDHDDDSDGEALTTAEGSQQDQHVVLLRHKSSSDAAEAVAAAAAVSSALRHSHLPLPALWPAPGERMWWLDFARGGRAAVRMLPGRLAAEAYHPCLPHGEKLAFVRGVARALGALWEIPLPPRCRGAVGGELTAVVGGQGEAELQVEEGGSGGPGRSSSASVRAWLLAQVRGALDALEMMVAAMTTITTADQTRTTRDDGDEDADDDLSSYSYLRGLFPQGRFTAADGGRAYDEDEWLARRRRLLPRIRELVRDRLEAAMPACVEEVPVVLAHGGLTLDNIVTLSFAAPSAVLSPSASTTTTPNPAALPGDADDEGDARIALLDYAAGPLRALPFAAQWALIEAFFRRSGGGGAPTGPEVEGAAGLRAAFWAAAPRRWAWESARPGAQALVEWLRFALFLGLPPSSPPPTAASASAAAGMAGAAGGYQEWQRLQQHLQQQRQRGPTTGAGRKRTIDEFREQEDEDHEHAAAVCAEGERVVGEMLGRYL